MQLSSDVGEVFSRSRCVMGATLPLQVMCRLFHSTGWGESTKIGA